MAHSRLSKLQSLQAIVELNEFVVFVEANVCYSHSLNRSVEKLVAAWINAMPNMHTDPPSTWDDVVLNRCILCVLTSFFLSSYFSLTIRLTMLLLYFNSSSKSIEYIEDKYYAREQQTSDTAMNSMMMDRTTMPPPHEVEDEDEDECKANMRLKLDKSKVLMKIKFAEAAYSQGHTRLALGKLQETRQIIKSATSSLTSDLPIVWMHSYLRTHLVRAKCATRHEDALAMFFSSMALKEIVKYDQNGELGKRHELYEQHQMLHASFAKFLVTAIVATSNDDDTVYRQLVGDEKKRAQLRDYTRIKDVSDIENV